MADGQPAHADSVLTNGSSDVQASDLSKQHDLLPKLIPHLDRHLVFPLLEDQYKDDPQLSKLEYELLKETNMVDYISGLWSEINHSKHIPSALLEKKSTVLRQLERYQEQSQKISDLLADEDVVKNLRSDKVANLNYLRDTHDVQPADVEVLYTFGRFQYDCGNYEQASELLYQYRILSTDPALVSAATWGKLGADILTAKWDSALEEINRVKEAIDTKLFNNPLAQLTHRTWLSHWLLFPLFNDEAAREPLTDLLLSPAFINTIQTTCPYLLRYLACSIITSRSNQTDQPSTARHGPTASFHKQLKDLVRIVKQESYEFKDPITEFVRALYIDFDFEEAQKRLKESDEVCRGDFFLCNSADLFIDSARHLISESYCKIHSRINIA